LPSLTFDAVLARIKPMRQNNGILKVKTGPVQRQDLLALIFRHDAFKVLEYLINVSRNYSAKLNAAIMIF